MSWSWLTWAVPLVAVLIGILLYSKKATELKAAVADRDNAELDLVVKDIHLSAVVNEVRALEQKERAADVKEASKVVDAKSAVDFLRASFGAGTKTRDQVPPPGVAKPS